MMFLTDFADQAVMLPLAAAILLTLLALGWPRGAASWGACVAGVLVVMLALKLVAVGCVRHLAWTGLVSPSGHTATAAVVYGGLLALLAPRIAPGMRIAALAGTAVALAIGLTRLVLHMHSVADVLLGAAVGVPGAVLLRRLAGPRPAGLRVPWVLAAACLVMLVFHGNRLEAETRIRWIALDVWPLSVCR